MRAQKKEYGFVQINGATVEEHPSVKDAGRMLQIRMTHPCVGGLAAWIYQHVPRTTRSQCLHLHREWREEKTNTPIAFVVEFNVRPSVFFALHASAPWLSSAHNQYAHVLTVLGSAQDEAQFRAWVKYNCVVLSPMTYWCTTALT